MNIAIIPARGGSKRIPRKNIKNFCGKPMIAWAIETAKASGLFDHVLVSTDDAEVTEIAKAWGAEVPFIRPAEIANDYAGTTEVIAHATEWALNQGWPVSAVCCIYATAPFIQADDLKRGLQALNSGNWAYAFTATDYASPIFRAFQQRSDGGIEMFSPENFSTRSQDLPVALHDAGQFYWGRPSSWIEGLRIFDQHSVPVIIPRWRVQDIDTLDDWHRAEVIYKLLEQTQMSTVKENSAAAPGAALPPASIQSYATSQEVFWAGQFGTDYINRNASQQLLAANLNFFTKALKQAGKISSCLELGANIGMNLKALQLLYPGIELTAAEINPDAAAQLRELIGQDNVYEGSIFDYPVTAKVDLSMIKGVLIHINPDMLNTVYEKLYQASSRYLLVAEYYNPSPVVIPYRGHSDRLFKRDFAGELLDKYPDLVLVDYGFAYHRDPAFPQDDITWFLLEKRA